MHILYLTKILSNGAILFCFYGFMYILYLTILPHRNRRLHSTHRSLIRRCVTVKPYMTLVEVHRISKQTLGMAQGSAKNSRNKIMA